ncbi:LysR substrate-binding domain-containing protein [Pseudomonas sp. HR96]|uniref:LysR substrate-binding domain-containing protein n=1 Tax=Pseudomonas sp. HR96 TaxID=1027966 RepID=UPI002A758A59|nr:LysR substrate-binding domain-containing protein [Pseudomonas sp. HR96]WPO98434.1 LysR substrate-binding domain-containing protein [Pseudomonas sp. HR96]
MRALPVALKKLPSLGSLKGFEACARHLNFSQAAAELHLTQSAISHQIKQLEETLGVSLFERQLGAITLTEQGAELLSVVRGFLRDMTRLVDRFARQTQRPVTLQVYVHDSFASTWLLPRLAGFTAQWPHIDVQIANEEFARFDGAAQVAIKNAPRGHLWPGLFTSLLLEEKMFPVCSPGLLETFGRPGHAAEVLNYPLIFRTRDMLNGGPVRAPSWDAWLDHHDLTYAPLNRALTVPHTHMAVLGAVRGLGVAMARTSHLGDELASGKLVKVWDEELDTDSGYHFLCAQGKEQSAPIAAFLCWLRAEVQASVR